jgi:hypothetical protein
MKKLITLTFALLFSAGIAFGQNNATTSQSGNNNQAKIAQHNSGNSAVFTQSGNDNFAHLNQTFLSGTGFGINEAEITQMGQSQVEDYSDYIGAKQVGAGNSFKVLQAPKGQHVYDITQGSSDMPSWNGVINIEQGISFIHQPNNGETPENVSTNYNIVYHASQFGNGNDLYVYQRDENRAYIQAQVSTAGDAADGNVIDIDQLGQESIVGQKINRQIEKQNYGAYQNGMNNVMDITQGTHDAAGTETVGSVFSSANNGGHGGQSLVQLGSDNTLTITQHDGGAATGFGGDYNTVEAALQNGMGNQATITQGAGSHSTAGVNQVGNFNTSTITQN